MYKITDNKTGQSVEKSLNQIGRVLTGNPAKRKVMKRLRAGETWNGTDYTIEPVNGVEALQRSLNAWFMGGQQ